MIDNASRQKFFVAVSDCLEKRGFSTRITEEGKLAVRNEKIPGTVKLLCVVEGNGVMPSLAWGRTTRMDTPQRRH